MSEADTKDVYQKLIDDGIIKPMSPCEEVKVLKIYSCNFDKDISNDFRYMARALRDARNMPFCFWGNSSGGVHSGFFFYKHSFELVDEYINDSDIVFMFGCEDISKEIKPIIKRFIDILREMDINAEYEIYWFGD